MPFTIVRNDITKVRADAIVNTANPSPRFGGGTDAAIYEAAGKDELLMARQAIGAIEPGEAAATDAFQLKARYIIHTVGPAWIDGAHGEFAILRSCYRESLRLAEQLGCQSIAFPLIATGTYGFPKNKALDIALSVIRKYLEVSDLMVKLVVFDRHSYELAADLQDEVAEYIDENYVRTARRAEYGVDRAVRRSRRQAVELDATLPFKACQAAPPAQDFIAKKLSLEDAVSHLGESFQARLLRMIDERGMTDAEVYKQANISRKVFSKIRCHDDYIPKKKTIVALAIALHLNLDDTQDLLASAGLTLTNNNKSDVIVMFCIDNAIYDIYTVNALLFKFHQPILGQV